MPAASTTTNAKNGIAKTIGDTASKTTIDKSKLGICIILKIKISCTKLNLQNLY